jgi:hypothetical protein
MYWSRAVALCLSGLLFPGTFTHAQGVGAPLTESDERTWMLALSALRDADAYEHTFAHFFLGFSDDTWFALSAGASRAPSKEDEVRARLVSLGIEHGFGPVGLGLSFEQWGDSGNLESRDWLGEIFFDGDNYRVGLTHEQRSIDVWFSGTGAPVATDFRRFGFDADGLGIDWRYRLSGQWQVYGSLADYDFPRGLRVIPRADRLDLLSTSAVTLAYGFIDRYASVGIERTFGAKLLNFDLSQDRSAIGGQRLNGLAASILWPVAPRMDLEFMLGQSKASGFESTTYGGLTLLIYGGG